MPDRSVKMKRRIFGFQRRVWWPKWTPASSSSRMETTAMRLLPWLTLALLRRARGAPAAEAGTRATAYPPGRGNGFGRILACRGERRFEVGRQRRGHVDVLARHRMRERETRGMQELPVQPELAGAAVDGVAGNREVDRRQVHPDLVRSSGLEPDPQQRVAPQQLLDLEVRHGGSGRIGVERVAQRVVPVPPDRRVDRAGPRARPTDDE